MRSVVITGRCFASIIRRVFPQINAEGVHHSIPVKERNLTFDVQGEGTLPTIDVEKPVTRTTKNQPIIQFNKMLLGQSQTKPLIITNRGNILTRVSFYRLKSFVAASAAYL